MRSLSTHSAKGRAAGILEVVRRNTLYALILLLVAISIGGFLGVLRIWQLGG